MLDYHPLPTQQNRANQESFHDKNSSLGQYKKMLDYHPLLTLQNPANPENFIPCIFLRIYQNYTAMTLTSD